MAIEIRIAPRDIDQIAVGHKATLRFPAFNQRTTPELSGNVTRIAADLTRETQNGADYYRARVKVADEELAKLAGLKLVPGMPVEAFVETGQRTALSYLVKPVTDQVARAFRER
jgi:HlyD family secretion protein